MFVSVCQIICSFHEAILDLSCGELVPSPSSKDQLSIRGVTLTPTNGYNFVIVLYVITS